MRHSSKAILVTGFLVLNLCGTRTASAGDSRGEFQRAIPAAPVSPAPAVRVVESHKPLKTAVSCTPLEKSDILVGLGRDEITKPLLDVTGNKSPDSPTTIDSTPNFKEGQAAYERGDFKKALNNLQPLAEQGDARSQYLLGQMYAPGTSFIEYIPAWIAWLSKAAEQGHAAAQQELGRIFESGRGVPQDYVQAAEWYRKAADQGCVHSQERLAAFYESGHGVPQDFAQAAIWYRKAADQGLSDAQIRLGLLYKTGRGVGQDDAQAAEWYRKAADQGRATAQTDLGYLYETGRGVPQDYVQAAFWYRKAADHGLVLALANLGVLYANGRGVKQDFAEASVLYRKAADQGNATAQNNLGTLYFHGHGLRQDYAQAAFWYRKAADQGNATAQNNLAWLYEKGLGVPQDQAEAAVWRKKAEALKGPQVITRPHVIQRPANSDMERYYPRRAMRMDIGGEVRLVCHVTVDGVTTGCSVDSESPPGFGFGEAALKLAPLFKMNPETINGQPVGDGEIIISIQFRNMN